MGLEFGNSKSEDEAMERVLDGEDRRNNEGDNFQWLEGDDAIVSDPKG